MGKLNSSYKKVVYSYSYKKIVFIFVAKVSNLRRPLFNNYHNYHIIIQRKEIIESKVAKEKNHKKKKKIVTEAPISCTILSIINQAAAKICNTNNLVQPGIRYNH